MSTQIIVGLVAFCVVATLVCMAWSDKNTKEYSDVDIDEFNNHIKRIKEEYKSNAEPHNELEKISLELDSITRNPLLASTLLELPTSKNDLKAYFMYVERLGLIQIDSDYIKVTKDYEKRTYSNSRVFIRKLLELFRDEDNEGHKISIAELNEATPKQINELLEIVENSKKLIKYKLGDKFNTELIGKALKLREFATKESDINKHNMYDYKTITYSPMMITLVSLANPITEYESSDNGTKETVLDILDRWFMTD